jgi:hypothetical protein
MNIKKKQDYPMKIIKNSCIFYFYHEGIYVQN